MKWSRSGVLAATLLIAAILVAMPAAVGATASQLWYLDGAPHSCGSPFSVMEKAWGAQAGWVTIGAGGCKTWLAENAAVCDVTFPGGAWVIELRIDEYEIGEPDPESLDEWEVHIGGWDTDLEQWYDIPTTTETFLTFDQGYNAVIIELQAESATILQGDYLALEVCNTDTNPHMISTDGESSLRSPHMDPGYPTPEVATVALLGLGLLGLVGYVGVRRVRAPK